MFFDHLWTSKYMPRTVISDEQNGGLQIFPSNLPWKHNIQHLLWSWLQVNCNSVSQVQQGSLLNWLTQKQEYVCPHLLLLFRCIFPQCFLLSPCWGGIFLCLRWCHETGLCRNHKLVQWKITSSANKTTESKHNSTGTQYVTLQIKIGWGKVKACQIGSAKWFWPSIFAQFSEAGKRHSKT
jgi:hypothetical protein